MMRCALFVCTVCAGRGLVPGREPSAAGLPAWDAGRNVSEPYFFPVTVLLSGM